MEYHVPVNSTIKPGSRSKKPCKSENIQVATPKTDLEIERNKVKELVKEVENLKTKIEQLEKRIEQNREDYKKDLKDKDDMVEYFRNLHFKYDV
jgi:outer membrane murein-binding lipoprotein Lpp